MTILKALLGLKVSAAKKAAKRAVKATTAHSRTTRALTIANSPHPLGSTKAKLWWKARVVPQVKSSATPAMKKKYGPSLTGMYRGGPLRPGPHPGDRDFSYMVDGLMIAGHSLDSATKIAGRTNQRLHGSSLRNVF